MVEEKKVSKYEKMEVSKAEFVTSSDGKVMYSVEQTKTKNKDTGAVYSGVKIYKGFPSSRGFGYNSKQFNSCIEFPSNISVSDLDKLKEAVIKQLEGLR